MTTNIHTILKVGEKKLCFYTFLCRTTTTLYKKKC